MANLTPEELVKQMRLVSLTGMEDVLRLILSVIKDGEVVTCVEVTSDGEVITSLTPEFEEFMKEDGK